MIHVADLRKNRLFDPTSTRFQGVLPPSGPRLIAERGRGQPPSGTRETSMARFVAAFAIPHPPSAIRHLSSAICHPPFVICHPPFVICHFSFPVPRSEFRIPHFLESGTDPPSAISHLPSAICHLPFLLPHSPFCIPHSVFLESGTDPPSANCHLPSANCHLPFLLPHSPFRISHSAFSRERNGLPNLWHKGNLVGPFDSGWPLSTLFLDTAALTASSFSSFHWPLATDHWPLFSRYSPLKPPPAWTSGVRSCADPPTLATV